MKIAVAHETEFEAESTALAKKLSLPLCQQNHEANTLLLDNACDKQDFFLQYAGDKENYQLQLVSHDGGLGNALSIDFAGGTMGHRRLYGGGRGQPLAKAIGLKGGANPSIIDATAGMGRDAFVLATLGGHVTLIERSPILAALLEDALRRAAIHPELADIVQHRLQLISADSIDWLTHCEAGRRPEVVYLDPMYPHRSKSALVKKEMRVLRALVGDDIDAGELLQAALRCATKKVVVKRPKTAAPLPGPKPASNVQSKNTRYDVYPVQGVLA